MSCSDSGSEEMPLGAQGDLASRTLVLESKRFYLDVKENKRGRFIKIAEISADGRKEKHFTGSFDLEMIWGLVWHRKSCLYYRKFDCL